jgi:hypothetical protein
VGFKTYPPVIENRLSTQLRIMAIRSARVKGFFRAALLAFALLGAVPPGRPAPNPPSATGRRLEGRKGL